MKICLSTFAILCIAFFSVKAQSESVDTLAFDLIYDELVVTGQFEPGHYKNSLYQVEIITKEQIQELAFLDLGQALQFSSQITVSQDPVLGASISIRGVDANNIAILKDGVPMIGRINGAIDLSQISLDHIERIEIIEGPQSVLYGSGAAGGVINLITSNTMQSESIFKGFSIIESAGVLRNNLAYESHIDQWNISSNVFYLKDQHKSVDSLRTYEEVDLGNELLLKRKKYPWNPKSQYGYDGQVQYTLKSNASLKLNLSHNNSLVSSYGERRRLNFNPYAFDDFFKTQRNEISMTYKSSIKKVLYTSNIAYSDFQRSIEYKRIDFEKDEYLLDHTTTDSTRFQGVFSTINFNIPISSIIKLNSGISGNYELGRGERIEDVTMKDSSTAVSKNFGVFADLRIKFDPLVFSLGFRETLHSLYGANFSPSLQVKWSLNNSWTARAGWARGFRSPDLKERYINFIDVNHFIVGNSELGAEVSSDINIRLAYEYHKEKNAISAEAQIFRNNILNKIVLSEYETQKYKYENIENALVYGLTSSLSWSIPLVRIESNISLIHTEERLDNGLQFKSERPSFNSVSSVIFDIDKIAMKVNFLFSYVGSSSVYYNENGSINVNTALPYQMIHGSVSKSLLKDQLTIQLGLRNALNVRYRNYARTNLSSSHTGLGNNQNQLIGKGRSIYFSARYFLKKKNML